MPSTETLASTNGQVREATEKTAEMFKQNVHQVTERTGEMVAQLPKVDLAEGVQRYFEFVQKAVDLQREMATNWADLLTSMSGSLREQAESFGHLVAEQTDRVADLTNEQAATLEQTTREQTDSVEQTEKKLAHEVEQAEREQATARYEGQTKAELSDQLVDRGLPKSGTVDELVERLLAADSD